MKGKEFKETLTWSNFKEVKPESLKESIKGSYSDVMIKTESGSISMCQCYGETFIREEMLTKDTRRLVEIPVRIIKFWAYAPKGPGSK